MSEQLSPKVRPGGPGSLRVDLPSAAASHWTAQMKADVVMALQQGKITVSEACERYRLSSEELIGWQQALNDQGLAGLSARMVADRRRAARLAVEEAATVLLSNGERLACQITDIGPRGARICLETLDRLPPAFELRCHKTERSLPVVTVWQRQKSAGVQLHLHSAEVPENTDLGSWLIGMKAGQDTVT